MTDFLRSSRFLLAGAMLGIVASCGPGASAPASDAGVEPQEVVPSAAADGSAPADQADGGSESEVHAHEDGEGHEHDYDEVHEHAGGTAHVHGIADLAFVVENGRLTAEMISPLANFGLSEADGVFTQDVISALPSLIELSGGNCSAEAPVGEVDTSSGHTDGQVEFSWVCENPNAVTAARFTGFGTFPGFETINAVFVGDTVQKAAELTPSSPELSLK
ncbi:DUF2796 domain-containing protein [Hyphomonas sp.]|uniref:ZrgA family zinc uptake protein n=1 Tax=Hyphomonas sp. TaxID=87 RepID=UPI001BD0A8B0